MFNNIKNKKIANDIQILKSQTPNIDFKKLNINSNIFSFQNFCEQINLYLEIPYIDFYRCYPNNRLILLTNSKENLQYFYKENIYPYTWVHYQKPQKYQNGYIIWALTRSEFTSHQKYLENKHKNLFGIEHGYTIITNYMKYTDFFSIYEIDKVDIYSLSIYKIQKIYHSFLRICSDDLQLIEKNSVSFPHYIWPEKWFKSAIITPFETISENEQLSTHLVSLSPREKECVKWLLEGKTAEETGIILGISRKTIESYFENIRTKLNCNNKYQIIRKVIEYNVV